MTPEEYTKLWDEQEERCEEHLRDARTVLWITFVLWLCSLVLWAPSVFLVLTTLLQP